MTETSASQDLQELFGNLRAEWLRERLFTLFNEPAYFPSLREPRPCVLMGGRGTGKTTVLRCMSYEGQYALNGAASGQSNYIGLYQRINTNRVTAFFGPEQTDRQWQRIFSHYINLTIVEMIIGYLCWSEQTTPDATALGTEGCRNICRSLGIPPVESQSSLLAAIKNAVHDLEIYVNNLDGPAPVFSMLQSPIDVTVTELQKLDHFHGKMFYIILDEYENFLDYQQVIVNTLVKHSGDRYVFKIGVRELGWRVRSTINGTEQLISPADYELIHIEEKLDGHFSNFARKVCETRIAEWAKTAQCSYLPLDELLPELSYEDEAEQLRVDDHLVEFKRRLNRDEFDSAAILSAGNLAIYVFLNLNDHDYQATVKSLREFLQGNKQRKDQYNNYKYAHLFAIARNGAEISKYYCGNRVFSTISKNNIRFYLHLISAAIDRHRHAGKEVSEPVSYRDQTHAARAVGLQYLTELEGVTVQGVQIVKLILGFGRLFQLLSRNPVGAAPECVEFQIKKNSGATMETVSAATSLLTQAVMHLALVRSPGTKLATESDIREWDYGVHPIFSPYFSFSHRKKRKLDVEEVDVLNMVTHPQDTIKKLLQNRPYLAEQESPVQLRLFDEYFAGQNAPRSSN